MKTNKLWRVESRGNKGTGLLLPEGSLWILAKSSHQAAAKAERWLKKHQYSSYRVTKIEFEGTIDVF